MCKLLCKLRFPWLPSVPPSGTPYILYKDSSNRKSNQQNLGTIRCSNLCTEIIEFTSPDEVAVCNLASIALPRFATDGGFHHEKLYEITYIVTRNLNRVIDHNFYPVPEARASNLKHRPIGIGVQGLADAFIHLRMVSTLPGDAAFHALLKLVTQPTQPSALFTCPDAVPPRLRMCQPFDSLDARTLNKEIFETIYFAALSCSCDLSRDEGAYESYVGSPVSKGVLQFDMCVPLRPPHQCTSCDHLNVGATQVGRYAIGPMELERVACQDREARRAKLAAGGADAYRFDCTDPGQQ